jgi:anti-anti-sigma regulatory factor
VVLPLVGELERKRSEKLGQGLVTGVFERSARVAIIDMTGTHATANLESDEESLQILTRAFQAVRLLGVSVVITGMRADLATRFTECDLDMTGVATEPTLQMGIDRAARVRTDGK